MNKLNFFLTLVLVSSFAFAQSDEKSVDTKYRRSSLYTLMITDTSRTNEEVIKEYFITKLIPTKFNDHNLTNRFIGRIKDSKQIDVNNDFLTTQKIAGQLIAKWFNRDANGTFDMNLIKERGFYDASSLDIAKAKLTTRGMATLADAGEELIGNTFILILDSRYLNKEDIGSVANVGVNLLSNKLGSLGGARQIAFKLHS